MLRSEHIFLVCVDEIVRLRLEVDMTFPTFSVFEGSNVSRQQDGRTQPRWLTGSHTSLLVYIKYSVATAEA